MNPSNPLTMDSRKELLITYEKWLAKKHDSEIGHDTYKYIDEFIKSLPPQGSQYTKEEIIEAAKYTPIGERILSDLLIIMDDLRNEPPSPLGDNK